MVGGGGSAQPRVILWVLNVVWY